MSKAVLHPRTHPPHRGKITTGRSSYTNTREKTGEANNTTKADPDTDHFIIGHNGLSNDVFRAIPTARDTNGRNNSTKRQQKRMESQPKAVTGPKVAISASSSEKKKTDPDKSKQLSL